MKVKRLPLKYEKIWKKCRPFFKQGRPGDESHAKEVVEFILSYEGKLKFDNKIMIPVAMMHDIGHATILSEHFKFVTGSQKVENGKLVHMLTGAKIAREILTSVKYEKKAIKEIVDIISMHDADQLKNIEWKKLYSTKNKKLFHDIDSLDRYNEKRIRGMMSMFENKEELIKLLEKFLDNFFYAELREIARSDLDEIKNSDFIDQKKL